MTSETVRNHGQNKKKIKSGKEKYTHPSGQRKRRLPTLDYEGKEGAGGEQECRQKNCSTQHGTGFLLFIGSVVSPSESGSETAALV